MFVLTPPLKGPIPALAFAPAPTATPEEFVTESVAEIAVEPLWT